MPLPPAQQGQQGPGNILHYAADSGSVERTAALLSSGLIDIDEGGPMGWTPLMSAVASGHVPVATILASKGANLAIANDDGFTALLLATQHGHLAIVKMLLKAGADIETANPKGATPLHLAVCYGHSEVMRALIQAGANPDCRLASGETPLYAAADRGNVDMIRELLRAEANPLLAGTGGTRGDGLWFPLHAAVREGRSEVVRELIHQFGIEGCCGKSDAVEALCLAARYQHIDIMAMLMEAGVVDTGEGLVVAAGKGPEASVKILLEQKKGKTAGASAYVNYHNPLGDTPLLSCIFWYQPSSPRVARLLVDAGADTTSEVRMKRGNGGDDVVSSPSVARLRVDTGADTTSEVRITRGSGGDDVLFEGTPLAFTIHILSEKLANGKNATDELLHNLEAIRRLLLQVKAVHAVSWLWPSFIPFIAHAAEAKIRAKRASTPLTVMLPILGRRARRRGLLLSALFRYSSKPEPGSTHVAS